MSVPAPPPRRPPPIVMTSSISKLTPPVLTVMVVIVPFASVAISNVAPDPANSDVPAVPVNVDDTSYAAAVALNVPALAPSVPSSNVAIVPAMS